MDIRDMNYEDILCKAIAHSWDKVAPRYKPSFGELISCHCGSCGATRDVIRSPQTGEKLTDYQYEYTESYAELSALGYTKDEWNKILLQKERQLKRRKVA